MLKFKGNCLYSLTMQILTLFSLKRVLLFGKKEKKKKCHFGWITGLHSVNSLDLFSNLFCNFQQMHMEL